MAYISGNTGVIPRMHCSGGAVPLEIETEGTTMPHHGNVEEQRESRTGGEKTD